jgi:hypothetical protein
VISSPRKYVMQNLVTVVGFNDGSVHAIPLGSLRVSGISRARRGSTESPGRSVSESHPPEYGASSPFAA